MKSTPGLRKITKILGDEALVELQAMGADELRRTIVRCEENIRESEEARDADENLMRMREELKNARAPYVETIRYQRAKQRFAALCLEDTGSSDAVESKHA